MKPGFHGVRRIHLPVLPPFPLYCGAGGGGGVAAGSNARLSGRAVVRGRLLRVPGRRAAAAAEPVQDDRLLGVPARPRAVPQPDPRGRPAAPDGPGRRGDDLPAAAPQRRVAALGDGGHAARAARRVRDRGRAHGDGRGPVHLPRLRVHAAHPVANPGPVAGRAAGGPAGRVRRRRAQRRPAGAAHVPGRAAGPRPAPGRHLALAELARLAGGGRRDGRRLRGAGGGLRGVVPLLVGLVHAEPGRGVLPVGPGVLVRRMLRDQAASQRAGDLPVRDAVQPDPAR